ncbi:hypothetical protein RKE30_24135 [Streptomyces sp. Li-HN-5-11]|uniref:hypothetical protein n=1 Tax=Streptomyces sp. Li-HN-5-11 TaxID=3075432 RepID=UPI0028A8346A|nr:hypothetical protein [Streptomyces sp. Li-HN-5-11]WNM36629.1 hypothetical protein RKE30_24135 [Streptomyces sp. Li-HN-5-11]
MSRVVGTGNDGFGAAPGGVRNIVALPAVIARGGQLTVTADGCRSGGTLSSRAFTTTALRPFGGPGESARGVATVGLETRPGTYDITVVCGGRMLTRPAAVTVLGAVRGGVGGGTTSGATTADMAIGGGLVAAAVVGGGVFWLRRRSEKRV